MAIKSKARHDLTLRSIKREIAAGRDVAFWLDKAYTHYDNSLLTEEDIADYSPEEKKEFLAEMGIEASGLDNLITASYDLLGLISFLTDGKKECRAWTIRKGTKAPQAAGKIHSDFERGFIRASVIGYGDLEANNFDYAAVKAKGLQRTEGKEYVVKDGDVIEFLFNV